MIVRQETSTNFARLGKYLDHGDKHKGNYVEDPSKRVAWSETRNLAFLDRRRIVLAMTRYAGINDRVEKPVLHLIVSWQAGNKEKGIAPDNPTREEMTESADRLLGAVDLEEHQAWIVAHKDGGAPHLHIMVNKVHPYTSKCWDNAYSQARLWDEYRQLEKDFGWDQAGPDRLETLWKENRVRETYWERHYRELGRDAPFSKAIRYYCTERFEAATSWPDLVERLKEYSVHLEPRGRGMVAVNAGEYIALSSIRRDFSRPKLERRFGMGWETYRELERQGLSKEAIAAQAENPDPEESTPEAAQAKAAQTNSNEAEPSVRDGHEVEDERAAEEKRSETEGQAPGRPESRSEAEALGADRPESRRKPPVEEVVSKGVVPEEVAPEEVALERAARGEAASEETRPDRRATKEEMEEALRFAQGFYRQQYNRLPREHPAKAYLFELILEEGQGDDRQKSRRLTSLSKEAGVGYAPDERYALTRAAAREGISHLALCQAGLLERSNENEEISPEGHYSDRFRGQLMYPMTGKSEQVCGFEARSVAGEDGPKGLFVAGQARKGRGPIYITESPVSALQVQEVGLRAVALGAAEMQADQAQQVSAMLRKGEGPVVMFKGEEGGRNNAERAVARLIEAGERPEVVSLPDGHDASSYLSENGGKRLTRYADKWGQRWAPFIYERHAKGEGRDHLRGRAQGFGKLLDLAARAPTEPTRERLFVDVAREYVGQEHVDREAYASSPTAAEQGDKLRSRRFKSIRTAFESLLRRRDLPARSWEAVLSDYPELQEGALLRNSEHPWKRSFPNAKQLLPGSSLASSGSSPVVSKPGIPKADSENEKALDQVLNPSSEASGLNRETTGHGLVREWKHLREQAKSHVEARRQLEDEWIEELQASFADPESAKFAYRMNRMYHGAARARLAILYRKTHEEGYADPGAFRGSVPDREGATRERADEVGRQQELKRIHKDMSQHEAALVAMRGYEKDLARAYFELGANLQSQSKSRAGLGPAGGALPHKSKGAAFDVRGGLEERGGDSRERERGTPREHRQWQGLRERVKDEIDRRYHVRRAKEAYERVDRHIRISHYKRIGQEIDALANHSNLERSKQEVEITREDLKVEMGMMYRNPEKATERFVEASREEGFVKAFRSLAQTPSRFGEVRPNQNEQWRIRQDFAKNVASSGEALTRFKKNEVGYVAARHDLALALHAGMKGRAGQPVSEVSRKHASAAMAGLQAEYNRVRYEVVYNPTPAQLKKEAQDMMKGLSEEAQNHVVRMRERIQERVQVAERAEKALSASNRLDNAFRQLYQTPSESRARFEAEAFPDGMRGELEAFEKAAVRFMENPRSLGQLRNKVSSLIQLRDDGRREQRREITKDAVALYGDYVNIIGKLRKTLDKEGRSVLKKGGGYDPKALRGALVRIAGGEGFPGRTRQLKRMLGHVMDRERTRGISRF